MKKLVLIVVLLFGCDINESNYQQADKLLEKSIHTEIGMAGQWSIDFYYPEVIGGFHVTLVFEQMWYREWQKPCGTSKTMNNAPLAIFPASPEFVVPLIYGPDPLPYPFNAFDEDDFAFTTNIHLSSINHGWLTGIMRVNAGTYPNYTVEFFEFQATYFRPTYGSYYQLTGTIEMWGYDMPLNGFQFERIIPDEQVPCIPKED